jgi:hypothetical protein
MEKEVIFTGEPLNVGAVTLVPVLRTRVGCQSRAGGMVATGAKDVIGVVVISAEGLHAITVTGDELRLEKYPAVLAALGAA